jgi:hypothetical protein
MLEAERAGAKRAKDGKPPEGPSAIDQFDRDYRGVLRSSLKSGLERTGLPSGEANGVLHALELGLVRSDRVQDLDDESFEVEVSLPGSVVEGNFLVAEGGVARFSFKGENLRDQDVVLRVVSSVERSR